MKQTLFFVIFLTVASGICGQPYQDVSKLFGKGEYEKVIKLGLKYLEKDSINAPLNMLVGRAYTKKAQYKEAIPYLIKGTSINGDSWVRAWSFSHLGGCYYMTGDAYQAKSSLQACLKLNATPNATSFASKMMKDYCLNEYFDRWAVVETKHIRFHIQDTALVGNVSSYVSQRENAYLKINEYFNAEPPKMVDYYIWSSVDSMKSEIGVDHGIAISALCLIHSHYNQTRGHEITHILSDLGIKPVAKSKLINEGIAVYFDQTIRNRMEVARKGIAGAKVSIVDLWNTPEKYPEAYAYQVGGALVEFLAKNGSSDQLRILLGEQSIKNARKVYPNFDELVAQFEKELNS